MLLKSLVALAAIQATCLALPSQWASYHRGQKSMQSLVTGDYYVIRGTDDDVCWRYSDQSDASYLSIACSNGKISHRIRFCAEPDCISKQSLVPGRPYYILSDADGRSDEFACVRQGHGYGVGLSKRSCRDYEDDSRFFIRENHPGEYTLYSSAYGELKPDGTWLTPHGAGM
ncbi:hypothetical protein BGW42_002299, partial [Actinomortierella wolfii]